MQLTCVLVLTVAILEASAQSIGTSFRFNGYNSLNEGCENGVSAPGIRAHILETSQIRLPELVVPTLAQQTCDCVEAFVRPQIRKEIFAFSPIQRFVQAVPFTGARNVEVPAFQFSPSNSIPSRIFSEIIPSSIAGGKNQIFSRNGQTPAARPVKGVLEGSFPVVLNEGFLGNPDGSLTTVLGSSFPRDVTGSVSRSSDLLLAESSVVGRGFINRELSNGC